MHIRVDRKTLADAINIVAPAVPRASVYPALLCARIKTIVAPDKTSTHLEVCCSSLDARLSAVIPCESLDAADTQSQILIPMLNLQSLAKWLEGEFVEIQAVGETLSILRAEGSEYEFVAPDPSNFPEDIYGGDRFSEANKVKLKLEIPAADLARALRATHYAVASNRESRYTLQSILFTFSRDCLQLVAMDGYRLARATLPMQGALDLEEGAEYIVPELAVALLQHAIMVGKLDKTKLVFGPNRIVVGASGKNNKIQIVLKAKLVEGKYPGYQNATQINPVTRVTVNREEFIKVLRRISFMARNPLAYGIHISLGPTLVLRAADMSTGRAHERMPAISFEGEPQSFRVNQEYVMHFLDASQEDEVHLEVQDNRAPLHFYDAAKQESYIMPLIPLEDRGAATPASEEPKAASEEENVDIIP